VFDCSDTQNLRFTLGIEAVVLYTEDQPTSEEDSGENTSEEEELLQLEPRELVKTILQLRADLAKKTFLLKFLSNPAQDLARGRDAAVSIVNFYDSLIAATSISAVKLKTIACTAKPDKIDQATGYQHQSHPQSTSSQQPHQLSLSQPDNRNSQPPTSTPPQQELTDQARLNQAQVRTQHKQRPHNPQTTTHNRQQRSNRQTLYCKYCKIKGHSENNCRKIKECEYCHRRGHQTSECRMKRQEERQERLFQSIAAEQRQSNAILVQAMQKHLKPYTPHISHLSLQANGWPTSAIQPPNQQTTNSLQGPWYYASQPQRNGPPAHPLR